VDDEECHLNKNTVTSILHPIRSCIPRVWKSSSPSTGGLCFHLIFYLFFHVMTPHTSTWYSWYYHTPNTHEYEISSKTNSQIVDARRSFARSILSIGFFVTLLPLSREGNSASLVFHFQRRRRRRPRRQQQNTNNLSRHIASIRNNPSGK
jgi:hypothetical protein